MSSEFICKKEENQFLITLLQQVIEEKKRNSYSGRVTALPYVKAMKAISKAPFVIRNEHHARQVKGIGDTICPIVVQGLRNANKYVAGRQMNETRTVQNAIIAQLGQDRRQRQSRSHTQTPISRVYIPKLRSDGRNTATRAMFIVLGLSEQINEGGLAKHTIIHRARRHTPVDFNAKHDKYGVYDGFKGMSTLIGKGYVRKVKGKSLYRITETGFKAYKQHCQPSNADPVRLRANDYSNNLNRISAAPNTSHTPNAPKRTRNSAKSSQTKPRRNSVNNNNIIAQLPSLNNFDANGNGNNDLELQKVMRESRIMHNSNGQNEMELALQMSIADNTANANDESDFAIQTALQMSLSVNNNNSANDTDLERVLQMSLDNSENKENESGIQNGLQMDPQLYYWCRHCQPNLKYKTQRGYTKHMRKHGVLTENSNANNTNDKRNNRKRKLELDSDEIEILPNIKKQKRVQKKPSIAIDLDTVPLAPDALANNLNNNCFMIEDRVFQLKLLIDTAEQNLVSTDINVFNVIQWAKEKNVECQYVKLNNADYIFVCACVSEPNLVYVIDMAVERKRRDDLEQSVIFDGRGIAQKERLKRTPITRKYYIVEGEERMIGEIGHREKCKRFLEETERKDGYVIKYTLSKHESMDRICKWYKIVYYLLNEKGKGKELILKNKNGDFYTFKMFQESQRVHNSNGGNVNRKMFNELRGMGYTEQESREALIAVKNSSVQDAIDWIYQ